MFFLICVVELAVKPRFELSKINLGGVRPVMLVLVLVAPVLVLVLVVVGLVLVLVAPL